MKGRDRSLNTNRKNSSVYLKFIFIYSKNKPDLIISPVHYLKMKKAPIFIRRLLQTFISFVLCIIIFLGFHFRWNFRDARHHPLELPACLAEFPTSARVCSSPLHYLAPYSLGFDGTPCSCFCSMLSPAPVQTLTAPFQAPPLAPLSIFSLHIVIP